MPKNERYESESKEMFEHRKAMKGKARGKANAMAKMRERMKGKSPFAKAA